jgi:S-adenosylmethionine:tRNA ribosyltransferase-isomerase
MITKNDFFYEIPDELIAQVPAQKRDESRLLVCDSTSQKISDHFFSQLPDIVNNLFSLRKKDQKALFIVNNSKVYPARIRVSRKTGARGEVFLLETGDQETYSCLLRPLSKLKPGEILLSDSQQEPLFEVIQTNPPRVKIISPLSWKDFVKKYGEMPLPPYIARDPKKNKNSTTKISEMDEERYQTVYSKDDHLGSAAAPTAGLHFTPEIMLKCEASGIEFASTTLHVGLGTFSPVQTERIEDHAMHSEHYLLSKETLTKIETYLQKDWPIVFVGTTSLRSVESFFRRRPFSRDALKNLAKKSSLVNTFASEVDVWQETNLFIYPKDKEHKIIPHVGNGIMTNFHQPESTLIMLISALMGTHFCQTFYKHAIEKKYRFFSYGDSSLLIFSPTE